jgi:hypothetical protein
MTHISFLYLFLSEIEEMGRLLNEEDPNSPSNSKSPHFGLWREAKFAIFSLPFPPLIKN